MSELALHDLHLSYGRSGSAAVLGLNLRVAAGQLVCLLGPSGCGKTTTLRAVAGLLPVHRGRIELAGQDITHLPAHKRNFGLVFQSYALFPHLSVWENVAFGLRLRKTAEPELRQRCQEAVESVGLTGYEARLPAQLSGGQQQRVALARALVLRPPLLLLDEPLSNLDAALRLTMRAEIRRLQRASGATMLYVTHDQEEALALADRVVVMREGRIEQDASPQTLYERPATEFVARFMGYANVLAFEAGQLRPLSELGAGLGPPPASARPQHQRVAWRSHQVPVVAAGTAATVSGTVLARSYLGQSLQFLVQTALGPIKGEAAPDAPWQEGHTVGLDLDVNRGVTIGAGDQT